MLCQIFDHVAVMDPDGQIEPIVRNALSEFGRTEDRDMGILIGVLFEIAACHDSERVSLAVHAGDSQLQRIGVDRVHNCFRRLKTMVQERILNCVDKGKDGADSQSRVAPYRWIWTARSSDSRCVQSGDRCGRPTVEFRLSSLEESFGLC